jgi:hypothetical protein
MEGVPDRVEEPEHTGGHCMAKRPNYGFVKREKELKKQQKKAEKLEKKRAAKESTDQPDVQEDEESDEDE